jgi:cytoskeletal protein RodZ
VTSMICVLQLEQLRRQTGISLQAISESTKISTSYLRAIESEEFEKLPGGVFNTNYIRQYAVAIGYPAADLLDFYKTKLAAEETAAATELPPPPSGVVRSCLNWLRNPSPLAR